MSKVLPFGSIFSKFQRIKKFVHIIITLKVTFIGELQRLGNRNNNPKITQKIGKERENSYREVKRSPEDRHTQTHGYLVNIFRRSQMFFSIRRE